MKTKNQPASLYTLRKQPIQKRSKATIEFILDAATQLLLTHGYDKVSTNKVADLAGISIGSLYEYFPGKEAIFAEIQRREARRLYKLTLAKPTPQTVREMMRLHVSTYLELVCSNLNLHAALVKDVPQFAVVDSEATIYSKYFQLSNSFLEAHKEELRPECDVAVVTELMSHVVRATINEYALHAPHRLQEAAVADELQNMLERYLLR